MELYHYVLIVILMAVLDGVWISLNMSVYNDATKAVQGTGIQVDYWGMVMSYACVFLLLAFYVLPTAKSALHKDATPYDKFFVALKCGGLLGLLVYGVYNFTCKAILKKYPWDVAVRDTMWGGALFTLVCFGVLLLQTHH